MFLLFLDDCSSQKENEEAFLDDHVTKWQPGRGLYTRVNMGSTGVLPLVDDALTFPHSVAKQM